MGKHKIDFMDDDQFRQLLDWFNFSWSGYRKVKKGVKKRISRHMQELDCPNISVYLNLLNKSDAIRDECERRMTVSISRFFRDQKLWLDLEQKILPDLIEAEKSAIKVWSAGCARGEEVYSFMIVWHRLTAVYEHLPKLEITATDMNPEYLEQAQTGIFSKSSLKEVPEEIRAVYFDKRKSGNRFEIKPFLKKSIDWRRQNIFDDPPGSLFHIIFLRNNILTYFQNHLKKEGLNKVIQGLVSGGWLIVGSHEKLPDKTANFIRHSSIPWAYRKEGTV